MAGDFLSASHRGQSQGANEPPITDGDGRPATIQSTWDTGDNWSRWRFSPAFYLADQLRTCSLSRPLAAEAELGVVEHSDRRVLEAQSKRLSFVVEVLCAVTEEISLTGRKFGVGCMMNPVFYHSLFTLSRQTPR